MSVIQWIRSTPLLSTVYKSSIIPRAKIKLHRISSYLPLGSHILDIGSGNAGLAYLLQQNDQQVNALDVIDHSFFTSVPIELYDGHHIPYKENAFEYSLLITVLHHIKDPVAILKEAIRVSEKVIVMEDVFTSNWNKKLLFFMDSLVNFEFFGHPHSNKSDVEWENTFKSLKLVIEEKRTDKILGIFRQVSYVLKKE